MCGDPHEKLLVVPPSEQQAASRHAEDTVLVKTGLQGQHLQLLLDSTETFRLKLHCAHFHVSKSLQPGTVKFYHLMLLLLEI